MSTHGSTAPVGAEPHTVIVSGAGTGFRQEIVVGPHRLVGDEPVAVGGTDEGPTPYDLILAALGSCTSMTISMYARRKQWPVESVTVTLRHSRIHAADCETCETKAGRLDRIDATIELVGPLDEAQRAKLLEIAHKCPVHRTLTSETEIRAVLA
ncbi:MAG TPA: OsmC family protein [Gemmatimonadaceae bacterium]|nr:OsmC family protein [Gemmatimonadaceae bacterium]